MSEATTILHVDCLCDREAEDLRFANGCGVGADSMPHGALSSMPFAFSNARQMRQIIDLTQTLRDGMHVYEGDPPVHIAVVRTRAGDGWEVRSLSMGSHTGTHCDAPSHMHDNGASLDETPLTQFCGAARAVTRSASGYPKETGLLFLDLITEDDAPGIIAAEPPFVGGDMDEAAERALLQKGIVTYTDLVNLDLLPRETVFQFYGFPLKIESGDGSPVRAVAVIE